MRYITAFLMKLVMITAVLWIVLGLFYGVNFGDILTTSIILSALAFAGDVFLLPRIGTVLAVIGDFALAFLTIWALGDALFAFDIPVLTVALISSLIIGIGEIFYHRYMRDQVFAGLEKDFRRSHNMQTEYSDEIKPYKDDKKD